MPADRTPEERAREIVADIIPSVWSDTARIPDWVHAELDAHEKTKTIAAIASAIRSAVSENNEAWWPIDTAPKDGTRILAFYPRAVAAEGKRGVIEIIHRHDPGGRYETWVRDDGEPCLYAPPTHWMLLPATPRTE